MTYAMLGIVHRLPLQSFDRYRPKCVWALPSLNINLCRNIANQSALKSSTSYKWIARYDRHINTT